MASYLNSQRVQRAMLWLSVLLLVAGVVVFIGTRTGDKDLGATSLPPETAPQATPADPFAAETTKTTATATAKDVPRAARVVAGQFILAAAGREDLPKAWRLAHPTLRQQCGCTYKEWLTGNINVEYYPVDNLEIASFAVQEVKQNEIFLNVALLPGKGSKVKPQTFMIGLRGVGTGKKRKWRVDYWAPFAATPVPAGGDGNQ